jgi:WD40 repeat protein
MKLLDRGNAVKRSNAVRMRRIGVVLTCLAAGSLALPAVSAAESLAGKVMIVTDFPGSKTGMRLREYTTAGAEVGDPGRHFGVETGFAAEASNGKKMLLMRTNGDFALVNVNGSGHATYLSRPSNYGGLAKQFEDWTELGPSPGYYRKLALGPSGDSLAYAGANGQEYTLDLAKHHARPVSVLAGWTPWSVQYSPNGDWLAIAAAKHTGDATETPVAIWIMHPNGTDARELLSCNDTDAHPEAGCRSLSWYPDGDEIAFVAEHMQTDNSGSSDVYWSVYRINIDSRNVRTVVEGSETAAGCTTNAEQVAVSPDGKRLAVGGGTIDPCDPSGWNLGKLWLLPATGESTISASTHAVMSLRQGTLDDNPGWAPSSGDRLPEDGVWWNWGHS